MCSRDYEFLNHDFLPAVLSNETAFRNYPGGLPIDKFLVRVELPLLIDIAKYFSIYGRSSLHASTYLPNWPNEFWARIFFGKFARTSRRFEYYIVQHLQPLILRKTIASLHRHLPNPIRPYGWRAREDPIFQVRCFSCGSTSKNTPMGQFALCHICKAPHCCSHHDANKHLCPHTSGSSTYDNDQYISHNIISRLRELST